MYKIGQKVKVRKTIANGWLKIKAINKVKWMDEEMEELIVDIVINL